MNTEKPQFIQHNSGVGCHVVESVAGCRITLINHKNIISFFCLVLILSNLC